MPTTDPISTDELAELDAHAAPIPGTQLVHVLVGRAGLVLTRAQAKRLAGELRVAAGHAGNRGPAGRGPGTRGR